MQATVLSRDGLLDRVAHDVIGHGAPIETPFGVRHLLYADWTASGRALHSFEDIIRRDVLPLYGNPHTHTSAAGLQSSAFRAEARAHVAAAVNARVVGAGEHSDVVLWTGSGTTGAVDHLIRILGLQRAGALSSDASIARPDFVQAVVFVGPHEHHSNLLPWRESSALVVPIGEDSHGRLDQRALHAALVTYAGAPLRLGAFNAASNVTGAVERVDEISELLHRYGALAVWDCATAMAHAIVDTNPVVVGADGGHNPWVYKDALVFSSHKLAGGVGGPGVLVLKRRLLRKAGVPAVPGGGTVFWVTEQDHRYAARAEEREEGGTPDILGALRCGLACQLQLRLGREALRAADARVSGALREGLRACPNVWVLGATDSAAAAAAAVTAGMAAGEGERAPECSLPIVSFVVRAPPPAAGQPWRFLHHAFVCALLSDLFGVQARGGCACAGPYALRLLGVSAADSARLEAALLGGAELLRPGFCRISLPPWTSEAEVQLVVGAVRVIASDGCVPLVGGWHVPSRQVLKSVWTSVTDWGMLRPGDRVLVGLSGGKDSLTMLHALREVQRHSPPGHFSLGVCTVDPGTTAFDPRPLIAYVQSLHVPMHYVTTPIFETAKLSMQGDSICAFCARLKRGALYGAAREHGYNVLALGQHLDDLAESFLMSALYNGLLRTMKGSYLIDGGDVRVIRPLMGVRERATRAFAYGCGLPVIADNCPACFELPKERKHVKKLLAAQEAIFPDTLAKLGRAMAPLNEPAVADVLAIVSRRHADPKRSRATARARQLAHGGGVGAGLGASASSSADALGLVALADEVQPLDAEQQASLALLSDATLLAEIARRQNALRRTLSGESRRRAVDDGCSGLDVEDDGCDDALLAVGCTNGLCTPRTVD